MTIDFSKNADKLFTTVFYLYRDAKTRYVVLFGGSGSSKSYSAHQVELLDLMTRKEGDTLILRKHGTDLRESCYKLINDLIDNYGLRQYFKSTYGNDNRRITYTPTGKSFIFKGVDDSEKLKSIVGVKRILMEEASQFDLADFMEIVRRARGMEDIRVSLLLNPISENHWIKKQLVDDTGAYTERTTLIKANYQLNRFLTADDIRELENIKKIDENQYRIYVLGEWGIEDKTKKFAYAFSMEKHVRPTEYNPEILLWLSFDFNVNPMTCIAAQYYDDELKIIKSFKLANSNIYELCRVIQSHYPDAIFKVTGDASGNNRSAMTKEATNYYQIIKDEIGLLNTQFNVPHANPRIEENQLLVNAVLLNVPVSIDPDNCAPLIYDLNYVEVGSNKKILKDRTTEERMADQLDCFRYLCNVLFPDVKRIIQRHVEVEE